MDLGLAGRTAVVVGIDGEVGAACRRVLEAEGATVVDGVSDGDGVDIVVAGAARRGTALLECRSAEELHDAWTPVVEAVRTYRTALPAMAARGWGRFVWIGTAAAKSLDADDDELGAIASLAMMAVHKVVRAEGGPAQVTANAVLAGEVASAEEVAATAAFLCSDGAGYLTGVTIAVDGGRGSGVF